MVVNECAPRTTVYSDAVLLDLILCLAQQVEECCNRKVTLTAPKIVDIFPRPGASATLADFKNLKLEKLGVAISFDTKMRQHSLENPSEWLRVMVVIESGTIAGAIPIPLRYVRTDAKTLAGARTNQTLFSEFGTPATSGGSSGQPDTNSSGDAGHARHDRDRVGLALMLVQARPTTSPSRRGLGPDGAARRRFAGTTLPPETLDLLSVGVGLALIPGMGTALATQFAKPASADAGVAQGSGNGIEGRISTPRSRTTSRAEGAT